MESQRKNLIVIRVSAKERAQFVKEARACGVPLSTWVRMTCLSRVWKNDPDRNIPVTQLPR